MKTTTNKLSERAMLIHISGHAWSGRKKDQKISTEVCVRANAEKDAGAWWTYLVPESELRPINSAYGRVYRRFCDLTAPWLDGGIRILPSDLFFKFREELGKLIAEHDKAVDKFLRERWPTIIVNHNKRLGNLAHNTPLPSAADLKRKFYISQDILPIPEMSDFRVKMGDEELADVRQEVERSMNEMMVKAIQHVWDRLANLVGKVAETMGQSDRTFRNSLISNLKEFCELIPKFNLTDDVDLEAIRNQVVSTLVSLDPEDLREIPNKRKAAAKDAKAILDKINDFLK